MNTNTQLRTVWDLERYNELSLRLIVSLAAIIIDFEKADRNRSTRSAVDLAGEMLFSIAGILDQAARITIDGIPLRPVIGFRDREPNGESETLMVPEFHSYMRDYVYPLMELLENRPDLGADSIGEFSREKLLEIDSLLQRRGLMD